MTVLVTGFKPLSPTIAKPSKTGSRRLFLGRSEVATVPFKFSQQALHDPRADPRLRLSEKATRLYAPRSHFINLTQISRLSVLSSPSAVR
ncbi:hypothetical protein Vi05172_g6594 [Venturia inaequalis]|nr:hypothetical protein Vi05172_g6594 [Venturia inaequalis]